MRLAFGTKMRSASQWIGLLVLVSLSSPVLVARDAPPSNPIKELRRDISATVQRAGRYLQETRGRDLDTALDEADDQQRLLKEDLEAYRNMVRDLRACVLEFGRLAEKSSWAKAAAFGGRFDEDKRDEFWKQVEEQVTKELRADLQQLRGCNRGNLMYDDEREHPRCCGEITEENNDSHSGLLRPDLDFSRDLGVIWAGFTDDFSSLSRNAIERAEVRFDRKLIEGFPGMPWEYVINFHGGSIYGPSPHQIIWAHFNMGFEDGVQVAPGDNRIQPVLTLQGLGYNRYFLSKDKGVWRKLNYLGVAGIITLNGRKGVKAIRYGGVVHFGNYVSVGSTYGDGAWRVYASSNKVVDQILKIWN